MKGNVMGKEVKMKKRENGEKKRVEKDVKRDIKIIKTHLKKKVRFEKV